MSVNNVRHMTYICHLQTLNHTYKHNLAPHAGFPTIPTLRRSFPPKPLERGGGGADLPLLLSPYEDGPMDFFIYLCLFFTYVHGKPRLNTFHHIHIGRPVPGVFTYGSTILLSVSPCP